MPNILEDLYYGKSVIVLCIIWCGIEKCIRQHLKSW